MVSSRSTPATKTATPPPAASPSLAYLGREAARPEAVAVDRARLRLRLVGTARQQMSELRGVVAYRPWTDRQRTQYYREGLSGVDVALLRHERDVEQALPLPNEEGVLELAGLPLAPCYHVGIWAPTGDYLARTGAIIDRPQRDIVVDLGDVDLERPTGLAVELVNFPAAHDAYRVRLMRSMPPAPIEHDMARRLVVREVNPPLWLAYDWPPEAEDTPGFPDYSRPLWLSTAAVTRLLPMFPDASARLVLFSPAGDVSEPLGVTLVPGVVSPLTIDVGALYPAGVRPCLMVEGRLVYAQTAEPVVGASIWREGHDTQAPPVVSDADGRFRFDCVPTRSISQFRVRVPPHADGRPRVAREQVFKLVAALFSEAATGSHTSVVWELPPLHWLVVATDEETDRRLRQQAAPGFPQYLVQEWSEEDQRWQTHRPDEFLFEGSGFAAAVSRPGRWRAAVAVGPLELRVTESTVVAGQPAEYQLAWASDQPPHRPRSILVTTKANGYPVERLLVRASSAPDAMAWSSAETDQRGIVSLGDVNADEMVLRLGQPPEDWEVRLDLREHTAELIEIQLESP